MKKQVYDEQVRRKKTVNETAAALLWEASHVPATCQIFLEYLRVNFMLVRICMLEKTPLTPLLNQVAVAWRFKKKRFEYQDQMGKCGWGKWHSALSQPPHFKCPWARTRTRNCPEDWWLAPLVLTSPIQTNAVPGKLIAGLWTSLHVRILRVQPKWDYWSRCQYPYTVHMYWAVLFF